MKIVHVGAGSFVFTPTVLSDAIERHRLDGLELVMVDLDLGGAEIMAGVARRMAEELGVRCRVSAASQRQAVLPGADFVILSAAPEGRKRWMMDFDILMRAGLTDQARECGGLGGLSHALRSIALALDIARDMERFCPRAVLLDVTNPMPRVVAAVNRFSPIRVYGFCNAAQRGRTGYERLASLLGRGMNELDVVTAGLNHFTWIVSVRDRATGADLLPRVCEIVRGGADRESRVLTRWLDRYGALAACGVDHTAEYLPFEADVHYHDSPPYHGTPEERVRRWKDLAAAASGQKPWREALTGGSWEHPVDVAVALHGGGPISIPMINLPNEGLLDDVPAGRIVEAPADVASDIVRGRKVGAMPGRTGALCAAVSAVNDRVAEGAARGDRRLLREAVEMDPAIADKPRSLATLDLLLAAHQDILPAFTT